MNKLLISDNDIKPIVSVVLPVYNSEKYIKEAIDSILCQSFTDFELIVIDDKSTDNTVEVIREFKDPRLKLYINEKNVGRAGSDNFALSVAQGKYIAKMDGDDICDPQRLEKQYRYLETHAEVNVLGTWIQSFGESKYLHQYPVDSRAIRCKTLLGMPIGNPSIMFRSELFFEKGMRYDESVKQAEDYDFFARYMDCISINVIPEPLLYYRTYPNEFKQDIIMERKKAVALVRRIFLRQRGFALTENEYGLLDIAYNLDEPLENYTLVDVAQLFNKIMLYNEHNKVFDRGELRTFLASRWFYLCYHYPQKKLKAIKAFYNSNLSKYNAVPYALKLKFFYKGLINF